MKIIELSPDKIVVPAECDIHNEAILKLYHFLFTCNERNWGQVPPAIVCGANAEGIAPGQRYLKDIEKDLIKYWSRKIECELDKVVRAGFDMEDILKNLLTTDSRFQMGDTKIQCENSITNLRNIKKECKEFKQIIDTAGYYLIDGNHRAIAATLANIPIKALELETNLDLEEIRKMVKDRKLIEFPRKDEKLTGLIYNFEHFCIGVGGLENTMTVENRVKRLIEKDEIPGYMIEQYIGKKYLKTE